MPQALFTNNGFSTLASGITDSATSLTVAAAGGALFPTSITTNYFYCTLIDTSNNLEIVKVTAVSTDTFTIVRAAESTTARAYSAGDRIELRPTAAGLSENVTAAATSAAAALVSEGLADADATATAADVVSTNADVVTTTQDAIDTAADVVLTNADVVSTNADVVSTNADVVLTDADATATALDKVATNADVVLTNADVVSTNADVVTVTNLYDSFDDRYLGDKSGDPTLDNDSNALIDGALYFNTTDNDMYVYDLGNTTWVSVSNATSSAAASASASAAAASAAEAAASAAGISWQAPVINATTANVTLSGEQTIDGILTATSRILVKDQSAPAENGVYLTGAGAWARDTPLDTWAEFVGAAVIVTTGSTQADSTWLCTADAGGTLETTSITFAAFGAGDMKASVYDAAAVAEQLVGLTASQTLTNKQMTTIELGAATDSTISRISAGILAIEGNNIITANITSSTTVAGVVELATAAEVVTGTDTARAATAAGISAQYSPITRVIQAQTGTTYTLVLGDAGALVTMSNASANTLTIPPNSSVAFATGTQIDIYNLGAGITSVTGGTGVTLNGVSTGTGALNAQYAAVTIIKVATDTWLMTGGHGAVA